MGKTARERQMSRTNSPWEIAKEARRTKRNRLRALGMLPKQSRSSTGLVIKHIVVNGEATERLISDGSTAAQRLAYAQTLRDNEEHIREAANARKSKATRKKGATRRESQQSVAERAAEATSLTGLKTPHGLKVGELNK